MQFWLEVPSVLVKRLLGVGWDCRVRNTNEWSLFSIIKYIISYQKELLALSFMYPHIVFTGSVLAAGVRPTGPGLGLVRSLPGG